MTIILIITSHWACSVAQDFNELKKVLKIFCGRGEIVLAVNDLISL